MLLNTTIKMFRLLVRGVYLYNWNVKTNECKIFKLERLERNKKNKLSESRAGLYNNISTFLSLGINPKTIQRLYF